MSPRQLAPPRSARIEAVMASPLIWQIASDLPDQDIGRPRRHPLAVHLAFGALARVYGSVRKLESDIIHGDLWPTIRTLYQQHSGGDTLPPFAPKLTVDAYKRSRQYLSGDDTFDLVVESFTSHSVSFARQIGLLLPNGPGSRTKPHPTRILFGDGTVVRPMYGKNARRQDPDAAVHTRHDGTIFGSNLVAFAARGAEPYQRVVLTVGRVDAPGGEADTALQLLRRLHPLVGDGALAVVYDGAFRGVHHHTLLTELGWILINKVHPAANTEGDRTWRTVTLGRWEHTVGKYTCGHNLVAHNGSVLEQYIDAEGNLAHSEALPRRQIRRTRSKAGFRFSLGVDVDCPRGGFTAWISPHTQPGDRTHRRPDQLRLIPPDDLQFSALYGLRNDSESINAEYKRTLYASRAATLGWRRQVLDLMSWAIASNSYAWAVHG